MTSYEWVPVPGLRGYYACREGFIKGPRKVLKGYAQRGAHLRVQVTLENGLTTKFLVHRLILLTFEGPCPAGLEVRHLNGNPQDNRVENLKYGTHSENTLDSVRHGTHNTLGKRKDKCPKGHPYSVENTYISPKGDRRCRECAKILSRNFYTPVAVKKPNFQSSKTHCPQGHPYDEINTGRSKKTGNRWCRACSRKRTAERKRQGLS